VREFIEIAFGEVGHRIAWRGKGVDEHGVDAATGRTLVQVDPRYFRPAEVDLLLGDPTKARMRLGWHHVVGFRELVREMVAADLVAVEQELRCHDAEV
jgi:GDPmannose 4,6-dehydratase